MASQLDHINTLLHKLKLVGVSECHSDVDTMVESLLCYEIICALEKSTELNTNVTVWSDVNPEIKDSLGLPNVMLVLTTSMKS